MAAATANRAADQTGAGRPFHERRFVAPSQRLAQYAAMSVGDVLQGSGDEDALPLISDCLKAVGTTHFNQAFIHLATGALGADQCMIFAHGEKTARCFLSYNNRPKWGTAALAEKYILQGWNRDPIRTRIAGRTGNGAVEVIPLAELAAEMSDSYRDAFFDTPGLVDKIAVLAQRDELVLCLNFYRHAESGPYDAMVTTRSKALWQVAAHMALLHYTSSHDHSLEDPLLTLSERERETCNLILSGLTTDAIAFEMKLRPNTVATYRKRAYEKLSINSRTALFALCR